MTSQDGWASQSIDYVKPREGVDAWSEEAGAQGVIGTQKILAAGPAVPPSAVALALGVAPEGQAVQRLRLIEVDGRPAEIAASWYPASIAAGTALAQPTKIRGGAVSALASLGHRITAVSEDVEARLPTSREADLLQIGAGEPVLVLTRVATDGSGDPIEVSVMIAPGSTRRLRYEMKVD